MRMTEANLMNAFSGESQAYIRYFIFGDKAKEEGYYGLSRLFKAVAFSERIHAYNHYTSLNATGVDRITTAMVPFSSGDSRENLVSAINGEAFEAGEMYPSFMNIAMYQGAESAFTSFYQAYTAEVRHKEMFEKAYKDVSSGKDATIGPIKVCRHCGYTIDDETPDICPICGAPRSEFKEFA